MKRIFFRFIKENNLNNIIFKYLNYNMNYDDCEFFNHVIRWDSTKEGYYFWKYIQLKYLLVLYIFYAINDKKNWYTEEIRKSFLNIKDYETTYKVEFVTENNKYCKKINDIIASYKNFIKING